MDQEKFKNEYGYPRNGVNQYFYQPIYKNFHYSDGVKDCLEAGCYWIIDHLGSETPELFIKYGDQGSLLIVTLHVQDSKAYFTGELEDDNEIYRSEIPYTDMPDGEFMFFISNQGDGVLRMFLPKEY